jgi:hypothetical protein
MPVVRPGVCVDPYPFCIFGYCLELWKRPPDNFEKGLHAVSPFLTCMVIQTMTPRTSMLWSRKQKYKVGTLTFPNPL